MAQQKGHKPSEASLAFNAAGSFRMNKNGIRAARQIAQSRRFIYDRPPVVCASCLPPRDPKAFTICPSCTQRREAGLR